MGLDKKGRDRETSKSSLPGIFIRGLVIFAVQHGRRRMEQRRPGGLRAIEHWAVRNGGRGGGGEGERHALSWETS